MEAHRSTQANIPHAEFRNVDAGPHGGQVGHLGDLGSGFQVGAQQIVQLRGGDNAADGTGNFEMFDLFRKASLTHGGLLPFLLRRAEILVAHAGPDGASGGVPQIGAGQRGGRLQFQIAKAQQWGASGDELSLIAENFGHGSRDFGVDQCSSQRFQREAAIDKLRPQGRKEHRQGRHALKPQREQE